MGARTMPELIQYRRPIAAANFMTSTSSITANALMPLVLTHEVVPPPADDFEIGEVGLPSWLGAVVLSLNSSTALMTMKAGLPIRSGAFSNR